MAYSESLFERTENPDSGHVINKQHFSAEKARFPDALRLSVGNGKPQGLLTAMGMAEIDNRQSWPVPTGL